MRLRFRIAMAFVVLAPLAALGWLGAELAEREREAERRRWAKSLEQRLANMAQAADELLADLEIELLALGSLSGKQTEHLRALNRRSGPVRQFFVVAPSGDMVYPDPKSDLTESEYHFLQRIRSVWLDWSFFSSGRPETAPQGKSGKGATYAASQGWEAWYWGDGLNLTFWWRDGRGYVSGAELSRARLLSDLVARLPATDADARTAPMERVALTNANGETLYRWGAYEPGPAEPSQAEYALAPPLAAWNLRWYGPGPGEALHGATFAWYASLAALGATFVAVAGFAYWESARAWREARQRVTFANQVSHELKTPLTNIRMYAEMLEAELDESDDAARRRLDVITSESHRLSRLIANILTFNRAQRSAIELRPASAEPDAVVRDTAETFRPTLAAKGMALELRLNAPGAARLDRSALEQILVNLVSNAEKYAREASKVVVETARNGDALLLTVADDGPGLSRGERRRVFRAFYRAGNKLTDGVAGTGIGLTIARSLARLHGGGVTAEAAGSGACFRVTLHAPLEEGEAE